MLLLLLLLLILQIHKYEHKLYFFRLFRFNSIDADDGDDDDNLVPVIQFNQIESDSIIMMIIIKIMEYKILVNIDSYVIGGGGGGGQVKSKQKNKLCKWEMGCFHLNVIEYANECCIYTGQKLTSNKNKNKN